MAEPLPLENPIYRIHCRKQIPAEALLCPFCGKEQKPQNQSADIPEQSAQIPQIPYSTAPPPYSGPMYGNSSPYYAPTPPHPTDMELVELARQYRAANNTRTWTFLAGLFCLWPLLIITYLESNKIKDIKARVAAKGIDPEIWIRYT